MILIRNATILTQDSKRQILKNAAICIKDGRILDIGISHELEKLYKKRAKKIIDGEGRVVMPGLINTHTHLAMTLLRGYADDMPLEKWWFEKVFPFEGKLKAEDVYWGSLLGGLEMIESGTTCFVDGYFFADAIVMAVEELGLRANIGIPVLDFKCPEFESPDDALAAAEKFLTKPRGAELIKFSIAPHMLQSTSLETYRKCKKLADRYKIILQTHLAETEAEVEYSRKKYKKTPVRLLVENRILDKNSLVAHVCHLTDDDVVLLAKSRVNVSHCPVSNMKLVSGLMPLKKLLNKGVNIGLGTDGACSNNNLDMFEEMKLSALVHKLAEKDPSAAEAQIILDMATINAAKAIGEEKNLGSIERGKAADIILLNFQQPHLLPDYNILSNLVYSARGNDVETAIINGQIVMENRKIQNVNENKILKIIRERYNAYSSNLILCAL